MRYNAALRRIKDTPEGFTLIEMLVVLAIIVLMSVLVLPNVSSYFKVSLNSATRDMASVVKESYNSAVVTGNTYRLVYDFKENNYWVESGPPGYLLDTKETKEKADRKKKFSSSSSSAEAPSAFKMDTTVTRKKKVLPTGVTYEDVVTQQSSDPITEGVAYTHFFPSGLAEQTLIHLKDQSDHHATLAITPLIGETDLYERYVKPDEAFKK